MPHRPSQKRLANLIRNLKGEQKRDDTLKIIGMASMLFDHVGLVFFPGFIWLRIIGRLALPIFAYGAAQGYQYTSNFRSYFWRLIIFGLAAQLPFMLLFEVNKLNILFTLAIGLLLLWATQKKYYLVAAAVVGFIIIVPIEYGIYGVLMVLGFYFLRKSRALSFLAQAGLTLTYFIVTKLWPQLFAILGVGVVLYLPLKNKKISLHKNIFYWFYPIHLCVLLMIKLMMG